MGEFRFETTGIPAPVVSLMQRRGAGAGLFKGSLSPWNMLPGAEKASQILADAVRSGELILIHGDFDADGITATATAVRVIRALGGKVQYYIPCRFQEGYGLGDRAVDRCLEINAKVLVTVDCGITSVEKVARLRSNGVKVVVTDHHKPADSLPDADAIVDPELSAQSDAMWRRLSGAGVILFVLRGLAERMRAGEIPELEPDLVSIGTVCDLVSLTGDNRVLVKRGIGTLKTNPTPGIQTLMRVIGIDNSCITAKDIGFGIGPVINSAGRIAHADQAVDLLLETDQGLAEEMASVLKGVNRERRSLDSAVYTEAGELLLGTDTAFAVAGSGNWHPGVIGISASRLARQMNRPVVLIAWDGDTGRGSARGVQGKPVYSILAGAMEQGLLFSFGGHEQAAGISLNRSRYSEFKTYVESAADTEYSTDDQQILYIDGGLTPCECNISVLKALEELAPFGEGNPEPVWITRRLYPSSFRSVGENGKHLQLCFQSGANTLRGIGFGMGHRTSELDRLLDVAFTLSTDSWRGGDAVQLVIRDIRPAAGRKQ
jgi:single-stranded-DNA-specific exonuclease